MNPITRMMKRYIKTPLKYALPLLFIGSLALVSISGCTSSTNPTATPTATPTPTDSLISAMMAQVANVHDVAWGGGSGGNATGLINQVNFGYGNGGDGANIMRFNTVANATAEYNYMINGAKELKSIAVRNETPNYWGLSYYTKAVGHTPSVQKATTAYVDGTYQEHQSVIQYDTFVILYGHDDNPNGTS